MEQIAHIRVHGTEHCVFISFCSVSRNLHIFKYDEHSCEYEVFPNVDDRFSLIRSTEWIKIPLKTVG